MGKLKFNQHKRLILSLIIMLVSQFIIAAPDDGLRAGAAKVLITPQTPVPMSGYGSRKGPFKGVHDDIFARAVVISDGVNKAAIISAEVIGFSHSFWEDCTTLISNKTGIRPEYILLSAVHNHSGPVLNVYNEGESPDIAAYISELKSKLAEVTLAAVRNLTPATLGAGKGECRMNINRRASNGHGEISLGRNPYGPCDHEVGVIRVNDFSGKPIAMLVSWPCHGVVLGPRNYLITGDWPGATSAYLENALGENVITPLIIGASGDINPIYGPHIDFEVTNSYAYGKDAIGEDLGKEVIRVADSIHPSGKGKISALQRVIFLPAKEWDGKSQQPESIRNDSLNVRLSAVKIGNIVLTGVSGEVFNQISVKMRAQSPYTNTFMVTHCNGSSGYLVTDEAYTIGGYEARSTRAKSGAEGAIIENLLEMISEL